MGSCDDGPAVRDSDHQHLACGLVIAWGGAFSGGGSSPNSEVTMTLSIGDTVRKVRRDNHDVLIPYTDEGHVEFEVAIPGTIVYEDDENGVSHQVLSGIKLRVVR